MINDPQQSTASAIAALLALAQGLPGQEREVLEVEWAALAGQRLCRLASADCSADLAEVTARELLLGKARTRNWARFDRHSYRRGRASHPLGRVALVRWRSGHWRQLRT